MAVIMICTTVTNETRDLRKKKRIAVSGIPSHSYGTALAIWDHSVTCHPTHPASRPLLDLPTPEGWKAELT